MPRDSGAAPILHPEEVEEKSVHGSIVAGGVEYYDQPVAQAGEL